MNMPTFLVMTTIQSGQAGGDPANVDHTILTCHDISPQQYFGYGAPHGHSCNPQHTARRTACRQAPGPENRYGIILKEGLAFSEKIPNAGNLRRVTMHKGMYCIIGSVDRDTGKILEFNFEDLYEININIIDMLTGIGRRGNGLDIWSTYRRRTL